MRRNVGRDQALAMITAGAGPPPFVGAKVTGLLHASGHVYDVQLTVEFAAAPLTPL
jgi:hypothetical protein